MASQLWNVWLTRKERVTLARIVRAAKAKDDVEMERNMDALDALEHGESFQAERSLMTQEDAVKWQVEFEEWVNANSAAAEAIPLTVGNARAVVSLYKEAVQARQITTDTGRMVRTAIKRLKRVDDGEEKEGEAEPVSKE